MESGMNYVLIALGIIEIIIGFNMEKFTRAKYSSQKIKDLEGLIKWEKYTSIIIGIVILIVAFLGISGMYEKFSNIAISSVLILLVVTYFGKRRFIR